MSPLEVVAELMQLEIELLAISAKIKKCRKDYESEVEEYFEPS
jgi:hypothetical protein